MSRAEHLRRIERPPPDAVPATPEAFLSALGGPSWIRVPGRDRSRTRAVATLLHGNEPSGLRAVHAWLRSGAVPAVDAAFFVGSVDAALAPPGFAHRALPGAEDLNRCFVPPFEGPRGELAAEVLRALGDAEPEALVDLHNNTGESPAYGVGPASGDAEHRLVSLFAGRFVHSTLRLGALVEATRDAFPSVTIECGRAGSEAADRAALVGLSRFLEVPELWADGVDGSAVEVYVDPVRVRMHPGLRLAFGESPRGSVDLTVVEGIDRHNFESLPAGARIGWLGERGVWPLEAVGADGRDASRDLFAERDRVLETRRPLVPIMMTADPQIALSDCLFYVVRPDPPAPKSTGPDPQDTAPTPV